MNANMLEQSSTMDKAYCDDNYNEAVKTEFVQLREFPFMHEAQRLVSATIWRKPFF
jgi:hypothetical protein